MAAGISQSKAVNVSTVRHLWLNLADITEEASESLQNFLAHLLRQWSGGSWRCGHSLLALRNIYHTDPNLHRKASGEPCLLQSEDWRKGQKVSAASWTHLGPMSCGI